MSDFDLFVIGAGSGGVRAARIAAAHGARVAIAEDDRFGGTCVIRGCVPKKLFVYASRFRDEFEDAPGFGWTLAQPSFDWPTLVANKDREIARLEAAYRGTLQRSGVEIFAQRATLTGPRSVRLADGREVSAGTILVATGSRPNRDERLPGIEHAITSDEAFHLPELPRHIIIAGGGYIAVEFAGIFRGLGVNTTLIYRGDEILRGFDGELRSHLREAMQERGIHFVFNDVFTRLQRTSDGLLTTMRSGLEVPADQVMFAIGRSPNTAGLGLERAGIIVDGAGAIPVDEFSRTTCASVYAVGDVTNRLNLTPVAIREGHAFADSVFGGQPTPVDHALVPTAVFSTPEIGTVGLTEEAAKARHAAVDVYRASFRPMRSTLAGRDERMLMKLLVDAGTDRVLGCHVIGPDAGEMAQLVGVALKMGARKADFDATMALHPTAAEELVTMRSPMERWRAESPAA